MNIARRTIALSFLALLPAWQAVTSGCSEDAIHASLLEPTPASGTASSADREETIWPLNDADLLIGHLDASGELLQADTTVRLVVSAKGHSQFDVYVSHIDGDLTADGRAIPDDSWLPMIGSSNESGTQLYASAHASGHTLEFDCDVVGDPDDDSYGFEGYFVVDSSDRVWMELNYSSSWVWDEVPSKE